MAYSEAIFPDRCRPAGVRLREFCLGHALLLQRLGSPFAAPVPVSGSWEVGDLALALAVCSRPWRDAAHMVNSVWRSHWGLLRNAWRVRRQTRRNAARLELLVYLTQAWTGPKVWIDPARAGARQDRLEVVEHALMLGYGMSEEAALDMPLKRALWAACKYWQAEGALQIRTEGEEDILDQVRKMRAQTAPAPEEGANG